MRCSSIMAPIMDVAPPLHATYNEDMQSSHTAKTENGKVKPFLRWAGSKRSVVRKLAEHSPPQFNRYIEPFVGSGALFFHLSPRCAILSDLNAEVVNLFEQIRRHPTELHRRLTSISRDKETYLAIRQSFGTKSEAIERAVSMLYLNRNCFNGLYRTNKSGKFNVPYAAAGRGKYPSQEDFQLCAKTLENSKVQHGDFFDVVSEHVTSNDFVYLDPPYLKSTGRIFSEYVKGHFSHEDTARLSLLLREINRKGAKFLLSFIDDPIIQEIANEWKTETYLVQKNISGFAASRRKSQEILVKNW
jgi:DNA adenine methylase